MRILDDFCSQERSSIVQGTTGGDQVSTEEGPRRDQVGTKRDLLATLESLRDDFGVTFGT